MKDEEIMRAGDADIIKMWTFASNVPTVVIGKQSEFRKLFEDNGVRINFKQLFIDFKKIYNDNKDEIIRKINLLQE